MRIQANSHNQYRKGDKKSNPNTNVISIMKAKSIALLGMYKRHQPTTTDIVLTPDITLWHTSLLYTNNYVMV